MAAKKPRVKIQLSSETDVELIKHLEGCANGHARRASLHVFILAALDDDVPVRIDMAALQGDPANSWPVELILPPTSPTRIRETYQHTTHSMRAITFRALIRHGFDSIQNGRGPRVASMYAPLVSTPFDIEQGAPSTPAPEAETTPAGQDDVDLPSPKVKHVHERHEPTLDDTSENHSSSELIQREIDELDALDEPEGNSSSEQPAFDMDRLLGSVR